MKNIPKRFQIAALVVIAALMLFGVSRLPFFSNPSETSISAADTVALPKSENMATVGAAVPATGKVTMIDLGATECIPCKMMAPIIEELKKEYAGRADIIFIDVWKNPAQAKKYGIRAIPTQIFFDTAGKELFRNTGFLDKKRIVEILTRLGVS
jgi:thioredoxin 1